MIASDQTLRVSELFYSLQGESSWSGLPTAFVRLTGCPLRCTYCDTEYAFQGGSLLSIAAILDKIAHWQPATVCVTGGEPLAQPECLSLLSHLCDRGYRVSLETGGALDIRGVDARVKVVLDLKTPGSGEQGRNLLSNIDVLKRQDEVKFVLTDKTDFDWAADMINRYALHERVDNVLFSPVHGAVDPRELAAWVLAQHLPVRMQLQLHKLIWGGEPGR